MDVSLFYEFSMICKHNNLSEAAKELHMTQTTLSRHIAAIERELGGELFDRTKNPMELTEMGQMFLRESSLISNEYFRIQALAKEIRGRTPQTLALSCVQTPRIASLVKAVRDQTTVDGWPLCVKFARPTYQTTLECLRDATLDVAIEPMSEFIDICELEHQHLFFEEAVVVMEAAHELAGSKALGLSDLQAIHYTSLRSNLDHALRKHLQHLCVLAGDPAGVPKRLSLSPSASTFDDLFFEGLGGQAVLLPQSLAARYVNQPDSGLVAVPAAGDETRYDFHAFWLKGAKPATLRLVEMLEQAERGSQST